MRIIKPVTIITGASSGIGAALAREFAKHGHDLALVALPEPTLEATADEIVAMGRPRPEVFPIDLGIRGATGGLARELIERRLEPTNIVNSAGFGRIGAAADLDHDEQLAMVELNTRVLTDLCLRWIDSLVRHQGGILNVGSIAGFFPGPGMAVYHATKAYILLFGEALHFELRPKGIRVTTLCPGPVDTPFMARAGIPTDYFPSILKRPAEYVARHGYHGFIQGECVVVPGSANRVFVSLLRFVPRGILMSLIGAGQRAAPAGGLVDGRAGGTRRGSQNV